MKLNALLVTLIVFMCCSAVVCQETGNKSSQPETRVNGLNNNTYGVRPEMLTGASPEMTEAEKQRQQEGDFQQLAAGLALAIDGLDKHISELRKQATAPTQEELDNIEQELILAEQQLDNLNTTSLTSLAQLQQAEMRDRLFGLRMTVDTMKRRWRGTWTIFGLEFFQNAPGIQASDAHTAPANYKIRVGDTIGILTTSKLGAQNQYKLVVSSNGTILVPGAGRVKAAGKTTRQFDNLLNSQISSKFKQLKVDVTVENIASIRVHVAGEVARPGSYVLNGMATAFTALHMAGGPTKAGTFRRITISRDGEPDRTIDLYNLLVNGSKKQDIPLEDGDLVFVPPVGKTITIGGEVVRPGRYEPDFPITLSQALKLAGGTKAGGYLQTVQVERVENSEYKTLLSTPVGADGSKAGFKIQPGDEVTVTTVRPDRTNQVSINGLIGSPGMYGFKSEMHVADLIKLAQGLSQDKEIYMGRADILRIDPLKGTELVTFNLEKALKGDNEQNVVLHKLDRVFIYSPEQVVFRPMLITLNGAVATPGTYKRSRGMRVSDAVAAAGGILPDAHLQRADLIRHKDGNTTELVKVDLQKALNGDPTSNVDLQDRDELTIYTTDQAGWRDRTIRIEGAVQRPGSYRRSEGMRVSDLVFTAGGLLPEGAQSVEVAHSGDAGTSAITKVDLTKLSVGSDADPVLNDGDIVTVPSMNPYLRTPEIIYITGEVAKPGPYVLTNQNEKLIDVITRAGGLTGFADSNGMMFLRRKESFQNTQQEKDADVVLKKSRIFADKEFMLALGKMGVTLPASLIASGVAAQEQFSKPVEVVPMKTNGAATTAQSGGQSVDKANSEATGDQESTNLQVNNATYDASMKKQAKSVAGKTGMATSEEEKAEEPTNAFGPRINAPDSKNQPGSYISEDPLSALAESARISVSLTRALKEPGSPDNLALRNGDRIFVPKQTNVVTVMGSVLHPHSFAAGPGKNADYYIERSGGFSQEASKGHVIVVRANGDALPKNAVKSVEPGDIIVVPSTGLMDISKKWERVGTATKVISDILSSVFVLTRF